MKQPLDKHGNPVRLWDVLVAQRDHGEKWRFLVLGSDTLHSSGSVKVECLQRVEPGFERRSISRYDLYRFYEVEPLRCSDLKFLKIIDEETTPDCCPFCEQGTHEDGEENYPHVVTTFKDVRVNFCCQCYDYVPVSALVGEEKANAWIDQALEARRRL